MVFDGEQMRFAKLLFATKQGMVKRVEGTEFQVAKRTIAATKLQEEDALILVQVVTENQQVALQTKGGYFLRFAAAEIRGRGCPGDQITEKGRTGAGLSV